jgi:hypothetical protein
MRWGTEWLTGLVRTMDAVTRGGACSPIDAGLRDRFDAHLRRTKPMARIPLAPIDEEAPTWRFEDVESH